MSVTMLWCFWIAVGVGVLGWFIAFGCAMDAHSKADAYRKELKQDFWDRNKYLREDIGNQAEELRLVNKAVNELECRLRTIKDLL